MMEMIKVTSSQIAAVGHDKATGVLTIRFVDRTKKDGTAIPGALYEYDGVPASVHKTLLAADRDPKLSVGQAFGRFVKDAGYSYRRIGP